jgi:hypothetical protein
MDCFTIEAMPTPGVKASNLAKLAPAETEDESVSARLAVRELIACSTDAGVSARLAVKEPTALPMEEGVKPREAATELLPVRPDAGVRATLALRVVVVVVLVLLACSMASAIANNPSEA